MLWLVLFTLLGFLVGALTGLLPGLHVNVTAAFLAAAAGTLTAIGISPLAAAAFVVSLTVTHVFFDVVPTVFLGVPGDETYALLPSQRLVLRGQGLTAVYHALHGSWGGLVGACALMLVGLAAGRAVPVAEAALAPIMGGVLLAVSAMLVLSDRHRGWALVVFMSSGLLGLIVFATPLVARDGAFTVLFPALGGLFGTSGLVLSLLSQEGELSPQEDVGLPPLDRRAVLAGTVGGAASGLLPGLGSANIAALLALRGRESAYLQAVAAVSASDHLFSIGALVLIGHARSGAASAIEQMTRLDAAGLVALCAVALLVGAACRWLLSCGAPRVASRVRDLPHRALTVAVLTFITALVGLTTGPWGIVVLATSTALGLVAPLSGTRRAHAMGMFLLPVSLGYLGWEGAVVAALGLGQVTVPHTAVGGAAAALSVVVALGLAVSAGCAMGRRWRLALGAAALAVVSVGVLLSALPDRLDLGGASGVVLRVKDGDTLVVRSDGAEMTVRLVDIDCPEKAQAFGRQARERVEALTGQGRVTVRVAGRDRYGRFLARVELADGTQLNRRLVEEGLAWRFDRYCDDPELLALQRKAQAERRGLWADPSPLPPWEFRHGKGGRPSPDETTEDAEAPPSPSPAAGAR